MMCFAIINDSSWKISYTRIKKLFPLAAIWLSQLFKEHNRIGRLKTNDLKINRMSHFFPIFVNFLKMIATAYIKRYHVQGT